MPSVRADTPLPTPSGWTTAGQARPGDLVFAAAGFPTTVTAVEPEVPETVLAVRVSGPAMIVSGDHDLVLGTPWWRPWLGDPALLGEREARMSQRFPRRVMLVLPEVDLPLDPWTYGYWRAAGIDDVLPVARVHETAAIEHLTRVGLEVTRVQVSGEQVFLQVPDMVRRLAATGAFSTEGLLPLYRRAGHRARLEMLAGTLDARATFRRGLKRFAVIHKGSREFCRDVVDVATSLGLRSGDSEGATIYARVHIENLTMLLRHEELAAAQRAAPLTMSRPPYYIHHAEPVAHEGEYVRLSTADGTYLVGRAMVPVRDH